MFADPAFYQAVNEIGYGEVTGTKLYETKKFVRYFLEKIHAELNRVVSEKPSKKLICRKNIRDEKPIRE